MLSFGLITLNPKNDAVYFKEIAKRSSQFDIECFRFMPWQIDPSTEIVNGEKFNSATCQWEPCVFPIPNILYDRCFYGEDIRSKQCKEIVKWLKMRKDIAFLGHGLPNKLDLYEAIKHSKLSPYLLPSEPVYAGENLLKQLAVQKAIVIKPVNGAQGRGIYLLKKRKKEFTVQTEKSGKQITRKFTGEHVFISWINRLIKERKYLFQPYVDLSNEDNQPFDIRTLLQKNEHGYWKEICRGIRTGKEGGLISNLSAGGHISSFDSWAAALPKSKRTFIFNELNDILNCLPKIVEEKFPPLFELGVDIGVSRDGAIWILDINSKPGRKTALTVNPKLSEQLYTAPLIFCKQAANYIFEEGSNGNEKKISN